MTNTDRVKILTEQADFIHSQVQSLRLLIQGTPIGGHISLHPAGLNQIANTLEGIAKHVESVAADINKNEVRS